MGAFAKSWSEGDVGMRDTLPKRLGRIRTAPGPQGASPTDRGSHNTIGGERCDRHDPTKTGRLARPPGGQGNARRPEAWSSGSSRLAELGTGRRTMQQRLYWLDYDPVALAVLVIGMGLIGLLALLV
jgi:hypothetical protein